METETASAKNENFLSTQRELNKSFSSLDVQARPQSFQAVPADGKFNAGPPDPEGEVAPAPGENILNIFQMDQAGLVDTVTSSAAQPRLLDAQGRAVIV